MQSALYASFHVSLYMSFHVSAYDRSSACMCWVPAHAAAAGAVFRHTSCTLERDGTGRVHVTTEGSALNACAPARAHPPSELLSPMPPLLRAFAPPASGPLASTSASLSTSARLAAGSMLQCLFLFQGCSAGPFVMFYQGNSKGIGSPPRKKRSDFSPPTPQKKKNIL